MFSIGGAVDARILIGVGECAVNDDFEVPPVVRRPPDVAELRDRVEDTRVPAGRDTPPMAPG